MANPARFAVAVVCLGGCAAGALPMEVAPLSVATPVALPHPPQLVLVTIDGVRWQEIFDGVDPARAPTRPAPMLLPHLYALATRGIALRGISASGPRFVSLPGYRELLTGRRAAGCHDNHCGPLDEQSIFDELRLRAGLAPEAVCVVGSWETIADAASVEPGALAISVGRHGGVRDRLRVSAAASRLLDEGAAAGAYPGHQDYRPDRYTAALALEVLAVRRPRLLWVALGDTDEYAHRGDYRRYLDALGAADDFLGRLATLVDEDAVIVVTADHGRAAGFAEHGVAPESAAVWLVAAGGSLRPEGLVTAKRPRALADVAPTLRQLFDLPPDRSWRAGTVLPEVTTTPERHLSFAWNTPAVR